MNTNKRADRWPVWVRHIEARKKSGLSQAEYCRRHKLDQANFSVWKNKIERTKVDMVERSLIEVPVSRSDERLATLVSESQGKITINIKGNEIVISLER